MKPKLKVLIVFGLAFLAGCSDIQSLSSTQQEDATDPANYAQATEGQAALLSAFYGLDGALPSFASYRICGHFGFTDGMPVIFSTEVDIETLEAGDFQVTLQDGQNFSVGCATPAPAEDQGEFRTILLVGDFGSINNQPATVSVTGNIISLDQTTNFIGQSVAATLLEDGPFLVHAEVVDKANWQIGKQATRLPFGGGDACPASTKQIIRVVWSGGVTKPGGDEINDEEVQAYKVLLADNTTTRPFAIGDLGDGDNNHELCLDTETTVLSIEFPEGLMTDPREDLNPATTISL